MTYFIVVEHEQYDGDTTYTFRTDATLSRVKRWCRAKGYELIAYGDMQVFDFDEHDTVIREVMKEDIQTWLNETREQHRRWAQWEQSGNHELKPQAIEPVDIKYEFDGLYKMITGSPWNSMERIPSPSPLYDYKAVFTYGPRHE